MLYLTCPSCGYFLGNKTDEYEKKKDLICENPNLSEDEKSENIKKILIDLNIRRWCCRMRMMTYKRMVKEILPIPSD